MIRLALKAHLDSVRSFRDPDLVVCAAWPPAYIRSMLWIRHLQLRDLPFLVKDLVVGVVWSLRLRDKERLLGEWAAWRGTARAISEGFDPDEEDLRTVEEVAESVGRGHLVKESAAPSLGPED